MKNHVCNITLVIVAVILIALGVYAGVSVWSTAAPSSAEVSVVDAPKADFQLPLAQLEGTWRVEHNGTRFVAYVVGETIQIDMIAPDGTSMTYWNGTFKASESAGQSIISNAVDSGKIVLSQSISKNFMIGEDTLSFDFSAMGMTKTMVMQRG